MNKESHKTSLVIVRHTPYGSTLARTSLDAALAMAAFDQEVKVLFLGEGVLNLLPHQDSQAVGVKNVGKLLASLPLYEIESVYVEAESATRYGLDPEAAPLPCLVVDSAGVRKLMSESDHLLGF